jgi:hypothetical protein
MPLALLNYGGPKANPFGDPYMEAVRRFFVHDQFEFFRLIDGQLSDRLAIQYASRVAASAVEQLSEVRPVGRKKP